MSPQDTTAPLGEDALQPSATAGERHQAAPAVDIFEDNDALVIVADMPGVSRDGVSASVEAGVLTIEGKAARPDAAESPLYAEYEVSDFHRCFTLGESIDPAGISASLKDGVLTVHLPKAAEAQTRKIEITGE